MLLVLLSAERNVKLSVNGKSVIADKYNKTGITNCIRVILLLTHYKPFLAEMR